MNSMSVYCRASERGSILVTVMVLVLLVGGLSLSLLIEVQGDVISVRHKETSMKALAIAEMGLVQSELELFGMRDNAADGIGDVEGPAGGGRYQTRAVPHPTLDGRWILTATGTHGHSVRRIELGVRRRSRTHRTVGLYSKETLTLGGSSTTDSFDSRLGTYASQAVNNDGFGPYAKGEGHVGSGMDIVLQGSSAVVRGNAIPGPDFSTQISGGATVWGDTMPRRQTVDVPPTPYEEFLAAYQNNQNALALGANAIGDTPAVIADATDASLVGLPDADVDGFKEAETMLLTDTQVRGMTFGDLMTDSYTTRLDVPAETMTYMLAKYESDLSNGTFTLSGETTLQPVDTVYDGVESDDDTYYPITDPLTGGTTTTAVKANRAGRVSYNPDTAELRATAGAEIVLDGGTYFFSDVRLVGQAKLVVRGPTKIYVTGRFDLGGGSIVNEAGGAPDLQIHVHNYALPPASPPASSFVKIRGGAGMAASIYAPEAEVSVGGGGDVYGSIVGKNISVLGNTAFHYDEALREVPENKAGRLERLYWRELNSPLR